MTRVLEFGPLALFSRVQPETTVRFWTGIDPHDSLGEPIRRWGPRRFLELQRSLGNDHFDLIVCHVPFHPLRLRDPRWLAYEFISRTRAAPLVALDLNDRIPLTPTALKLLDRCHMYFKRELPIDRDKLVTNPSARQKGVLARNLSKLRPISIGLAPWRIADLPDPLPEKTTDIFYSGTFNLEIRSRGAEQLDRLAQEGIRVDLSRERLDRKEYLRRTAQAYLVWSPEGLGWQCFRHLEVSAAASVPVINHSAIEQVKPLQQDRHCLHYHPDGDDLLQVIRAALTDKQRLQKMGQAARHHVLTNHMHANSVAYILSTALSAGLRNQRQRVAEPEPLTIFHTGVPAELEFIVAMTQDSKCR